MMCSDTTHKLSASLRTALGQTWDLNVRAIPTSIAWGISLIFVLQSSSLPTRLICSVLCSLISFMNTSIVKFTPIRPSIQQLVRSREIKNVIALNILVGILFILALNNLFRIDLQNALYSLLLISVAITLFIGWVFIMLVLNPISILKISTASNEPIANLLIVYLQKCKKEVFLTALILLTSAPLLFVFISVTLTLTQALTVLTFERLTFNATSEADIHNG